MTNNQKDKKAKKKKKEGYRKNSDITMSLREKLEKQEKNKKDE